jgi:shikimate dehydrogenase
MKKKQAKEVYALADLQNWQSATREVDPPIRLGVLGDPVAQSFSPEIQNAALKAGQIDLQYARFYIHPEELQAALSLLPKLDFAGANLTLPHKIAALGFVDELDDEAKQIGAVNTIAVRDGKLIGFNTDGIGFTRAIRSEFSVDLRDLRVLLLGAGGAARAIAMQCAQANCERLVIVNRNFDRARQLVTELQPRFAGPRVLGPVARLEAVPWENKALQFQLGNVDLVVNATPLGLNPNGAAPLPRELLAPHLMIYDTVYTRGRTPFLIAADEAGARGVNGLSMLLHQGARSFEIWFGRKASIDVMRAALPL